MTIIEAMKSGMRFKRSIHREGFWMAPQDLCKSAENYKDEFLRDLIADDWEIEEQKIKSRRVNYARLLRDLLFTPGQK